MLYDNTVVMPIVFVFGLIIGSFLNVVILRSSRGASLGGRSACPECGHTLTWYELIPVLSYIMQRGRCRACGATISVQYPLVELACAMAAVMMFPNVIGFALFAVLLALFVTDLRTFLLPDFFVLLAAVLALFTGSISYGGVLIGAGFILFLWAITSGQGIGFGDVKIMIPLGMIFGVKGVVALLAGAFIVGGIVGTYLLLSGKAERKTAIPFGPYLTGFAMLFLVWPALVDVFWNGLGLDVFLR